MQSSTVCDKIVKKRRESEGMNFATSLIMACVFFRLFNFRAGGIDLMPDIVGIFLALSAAYILRKKEDDFREAYIPCAFALIFSLWNFANLLPEEAEAGFGIIYCALEGGLLIAETVMYKKLFDGFGSMYGEICTKGFNALKLYFISCTFGIGSSISVWFAEGSEALWWVPVIHIVWAVIHAVVATYLAYQFYVLKPKFRKR